MAGAKNTSFQIILFSGFFILAPLIGALLGYFSPQEVRQKAHTVLSSVLDSQKTPNNAGRTSGYQTITNSAGDLVCADGQRHEVPCWRMRLEREMVRDTADAYDPAGQDPLYGIIRERAGPQGSITTLGQQRDLQNTPKAKRKNSSNNRFASARQALSE